MPTGHTIPEYEPLATGRTQSLFAPDMIAHRDALLDRFQRRRIAIIGAAGSIGFSVVRPILQCCPRALVLFDLDENGLVEIVRDLRSSADIDMPDDFAELPIGLGSAAFTRYFQENEPFDYILNLSAMKHVRSEKNIYCLQRMVDTNVLFLDDFLRSLPRPCSRFFSVSSDKAVNPANLMGASKMVMEKALLLRAGRQPFSTARFANVAFSNGSLPYGFLMRIQKRQPIAAPDDVKRYFISHEEAGQLCTLACALGENGDVFFPKLDHLSETTFSEIAVRLLERLGYQPHECASEEEAKAKARELIPRKKWPCCFSMSDTTGEKAIEEFYGHGDEVALDRFQHIGVAPQSPDRVDKAAVEAFLAFARDARDRPSVTKSDYVAAFRRVIPTLQHEEKGKILDEKM